MTSTPILLSIPILASTLLLPPGLVLTSTSILAITTNVLQGEIEPTASGIAAAKTIGKLCGV